MGRILQTKKAHHWEKHVFIFIFSLLEERNSMPVPVSNGKSSKTNKKLSKVKIGITFFPKMYLPKVSALFLIQESAFVPCISLGLAKYKSPCRICLAYS